MSMSLKPCVDSAVGGASRSSSARKLRGNRAIGRQHIRRSGRCAQGVKFVELSAACGTLLFKSISGVVGCNMHVVPPLLG
jgi:hypothetical protein